MSKTKINVELHGWYVQIEFFDIEQRPNWEIRCEITRSREDRRERRGHRFYVSPELADKLGFKKRTQAQLQAFMTSGAKAVILREFDHIFSEPENGLDSLRPIEEIDLDS